MRRRCADALATCLVILAVGGLAAMAPAASASGAAAIPTTTTVNYSGYSAYPVSGTVVSVQAAWTVPKISCPPGLGFGPRVAIWVGMWGGLTSVKNDTAWLPQIGTDSYCSDGVDLYRGVYEVENASNPGEQTTTGLNVAAGDKVVATVSYVARDAAGKREFFLELYDGTQEPYEDPSWTAYVWTNKPVPKADIVREGGAMVEDMAPCSFLDCIKGLQTDDGLAKFDTPHRLVSLTSVVVDGGSGGYNFFQWKMVSKKGGKPLAKNSALHGTSYSGYWTGGYDVTWLRQK